MQSHHIQLSGQPFHYLTWGDPSLPPLLMLHGFPEYSVWAGRPNASAIVSPASPPTSTAKARAGLALAAAPGTFDAGAAVGWTLVGPSTLVAELD